MSTAIPTNNPEIQAAAMVAAATALAAKSIPATPETVVDMAEKILDQIEKKNVANRNVEAPYTPPTRVFRS